jgi:Domain of unknown function(DUF2779)
VRLSKSRLLAYLQCPKRLWLSVHRQELARYSQAARHGFETGHRVGEIARLLYAQGRETSVHADLRLLSAFNQAQGLLFPLEQQPGSKVFFEAAFRHEGVLIRADVLEYSAAGTRLIEVKSGAHVKEEYVPDIAIQKWVINGAGVSLSDIAVAHLNTRFVYPGNGEYRGLLVESPVGELATPLVPQVATWAHAATHTLAGPEPRISVGTHCRTPHECPFIRHCWPQTEYPITGLPRLGAKLDEYVSRGYRDVREVPEEEVSGEARLRVWRSTVANRPDIRPALREELRAIPYPRYYLDFETIEFAVPIWPGTRPRQAIPFQWSIHVERSAGAVEHVEYVDLSGELPVERLARNLLAALGQEGAIVSYSGYEGRCIQTLAGFVPECADELRALEPRLVDLLPIFRRNYYHPAMKGSWSIKAVLPTVAPEMRYDALGEVQEGDAAQRAYLEAINPLTSPARKAEIARALLEYCRFDTHAMVRLAQAF